MANFVKSLRTVLSHPYNQGHPFTTLLRVIFWKVNQLWLRLPMVVSLPAGVKCLCYPDSSFGSLVVYTGYPEQDMVKVLLKSLTAHQVMIDVGANIGLISLLAATKTQQKIYAFEADPRVIPRLTENVFLNALHQQIEVVRKAVSNRKGKLSFQLEAQSEISHIGYPNGLNKRQPVKASPSVRHKEAFTVQTTSLDTFVTARSISRGLVIKIDVEGAEQLVFKGMKKILASKQAKLILFEVNQHCRRFGYQPEELVELLEKSGYQVFRLDPIAKILRNQPILFADHTAFNCVAAPAKLLTVSKLRSMIGKR